MHPRSLILACALCASVAHAEGKPRLLVLDFKSSEKETQALAKALAQETVLALTDRDQYEVTGFTELTHAIELEGEKELTGCDSTTCAAEVAGALGAEWVVFGDVTHLDTLYVVGVQLYDAKNRRLVAREVVRGEDEATVLQGTHEAAQRLVPKAAGVSPVLVLGVVGAGGGMLVAGGGAVVLYLATDTLGDPNTTGHEKDQALGAVTAGWALIGAGALVVVVGATVAIGSVVLE